jgi:hypothetical protein
VDTKEYEKFEDLEYHGMKGQRTQSIRMGSSILNTETGPVADP